MILRYSEIQDQVLSAKKKSLNTLIEVYSVSKSVLSLIEHLPLTFVNLYEYLFVQKNKLDLEDSKKLLQLIEELVLLIKKDSERIGNGIYPKKVLLPDWSKEQVLGFLSYWSTECLKILKKNPRTKQGVSTALKTYEKWVSQADSSEFNGADLARVYQFELMFLGAMDVMRRMILAPLKKHYRYSEGEGLKILELGCGDGRFTQFLKIAFPKAKIISIDDNEALLREAQDKFRNEKRIHFLQCDAIDLPYKNEQFDIVVSSFFFSQVSYDYRRRILGEVHRVLQSNGVIGFVDFIQAEDRKEISWALHLFNREIKNLNFDTYYRNSIEGGVSHIGFTELAQDQGFLAKALLYKKNN